jgi:hypothetical protein
MLMVSRCPQLGSLQPEASPIEYDRPDKDVSPMLRHDRNWRGAL